MDCVVPTGAPLTLFYSYAHEDEPLRKQLEIHLSLLHRQGLISEWHDRKILPGATWAQEIDEHLERASIILLLISPAFLASDYCYDIEMQRALERHAQGLAYVVPLLLRAVDWQGAPFTHLQVLPRNAEPVTSWTNPDEAFAEISAGIRRVIEEYPGGPVVTPRVLFRPEPTPLLTHTPLSRVSSIEQQNRERLIWRVRSFWIEGVFKRSLHNTALMTPGLQESSEAVENPWRLVLQESEYASTSLPAGTRITEVYNEAHGELLILGEPGAGKTTLLLELARDLLNHAEQELALPIPVVFNLSSWTRKRQPLAAWLIEELETKYQVPRKISADWINADQILPLLDGLDEVDTTFRTACMQAINEYHQGHSLVPLVVCCRVNEYLSQVNRLKLHRAVTIQPLTTEQINEYFARLGEQGASLRTVFQNDPVLQELATTPLMLTILILAYQGSSLEEIEGGVSAEVRKPQIFATYTQRMLRRRKALPLYSPQQTIHWLGYLARQMKQQSQTMFYIERMQPDWLIGNRASWIYEYLAIRSPDVLLGSIVTLLITTMLFSAIFSITLELCYCSIGGLVSGLLGKEKRISPLTERNNVYVQRSLWKRIFDLRYLGNGLLLGLIYLMYGSAYGLRVELTYGLIFGLVGILLSSIFGQGMPKRPLGEKIGQPQENRWYNFINFGYLRIALVVGLSYGLGYGFSTEITNQLRISQSSVLANILSYVLAYILIGVLICLILERRKRAIQPAEMIVWSWRTLWRNLITIRYWGNGLFIGLLIGLIIGLSIGLREEQFTIGIFFGLNAGLIFGVSYWLLLAILKALSSEMIDEHQHVQPNQGTWASARNSIIIGFISGSISWLVCSLSYTLSYTYIDNFSAALSIGQLTARSIGLLIGVSAGLLYGLLNGGLAFLQHWTLRLLLWHAGSIPWSYPRFLDYAAERILLRKVGGGYIFIHQELLEYFASLNQDSL